MATKLKEAQKRLAIIDVNLRSSNISTRDDVDLHRTDTSQALTQSYRKCEGVEVYVKEGDESATSPIFEYRFLYRAGLRLVAENEKDVAESESYKPIIEIIALWESRYLSSLELDQEHIDEFSAENVGFHVWPYWREYVQSTCSRLGAPNAFEIPLYILQRSELNSKSQE
jgi:hypothetical protein